MSESTVWPERQSVPPLPADEVHVWCVGLSQSPANVAAMWTLLSTDEQVRANRFYFDKDRHHYIYGRGVLRTLIGQYEQVPAAAVAFVYGPQGKPSLASGDLRFNLSHAQGIALIGFTRGREIGVDVEAVRRLTDADQVAQRFFSEKECNVYSTVSDAEKPRAFFNCWTRKEAFIKAIGEGLSCPLDSFDVTLRPGEPACLQQVRGRQTAAAHWQLRSLDPTPGYVGAVLVEGQGWGLRCWRWQ